MVGKSNIPADYQERSPALQGASMTSEGLNPLDQEREASMADEGGMSGAVMESQDGDTARDPTSRRGAAPLQLQRRGFQRVVPHSGAPFWYVLGGLTVGLVMAVFFRRRA